MRQPRNRRIHRGQASVRHFVEHLETLIDQTKFHIHSRQGGGRVKISKKAGFEEMGVQDSSLRSVFELGACFEKRRKREPVRARRRRVALRVQENGFSEEPIFYQLQYVALHRMIVSKWWPLLTSGRYPHWRPSQLFEKLW
ncbi:hypothetical protein TorRG33x02_041330, partial [Trema orientale]